eukprot:scaffold26478_cov90-Isochrysis_galbana.AAC.3
MSDSTVSMPSASKKPNRCGSIGPATSVSTVSACPPSRSSASSRVTRLPCWVSSHAAARPEIPDPMTTTVSGSALLGIGSAAYLRGAIRNSRSMTRGTRWRWGAEPFLVWPLARSQSNFRQKTQDRSPILQDLRRIDCYLAFFRLRFGVRFV